MDTALRRWHNSMLMSAFLAWREFVAYKKDRAQLCEEEEEEDEEEEEEEDEEEELEEMAEEKEEKEEEEEEEEEEAKVQTKKAKQAQTEKEQRGFEENKGSGKSIRGADGRGKGRVVKANRDGASAERDAPPHLPRDDVGPTENEAAVKSSGGGRGVADHARPHVLAEGTESLDGGTSGVLAELLASSPSKRSKAASQEAEPSAPGVASDDEGESDVFAPALHSPSAPNSHTSSATAVASSQQQQQQHQHQHQQGSQPGSGSTSPTRSPQQRQQQEEQQSALLSPTGASPRRRSRLRRRHSTLQAAVAALLAHPRRSSRSNSNNSSSKPQSASKNVRVVWGVCGVCGCVEVWKGGKGTFVFFVCLSCYLSCERHPHTLTCSVPACFRAWRHVQYAALRRMKMVVEPGMSGLRNLGQTCYMNAVLQVLSHIAIYRLSLYDLGKRGLLLLLDQNSRINGSAAEEGGASSQSASQATQHEPAARSSSRNGTKVPNGESKGRGSGSASAAQPGGRGSRSSESNGGSVAGKRPGSGVSALVSGPLERQTTTECFTYLQTPLPGMRSYLRARPRGMPVLCACVRVRVRVRAPVRVRVRDDLSLSLSLSLSVCVCVCACFALPSLPFF